MKYYQVKTIILAVVASMALQSVAAQVVNIEDKRIKTDTSGWSGSGEASLFMNKNNDFLLSLMLDLHIQYKTKKSYHLKIHINGVHRKFKPFKCSNCDRGWFDIINSRFIQL